MTLTLTFDLLLKKLNLGYNFWTRRDEAFILHMWFPCGKTFLSIPKFLPLPWLLTYFSKNLTLAITFEPKEVRLSYYICGFLMTRPFCSYQKFWPWLLPYFSRNLTLAITFEPKEIGLSKHRFVCLVARRFCLFQKIWPRTLTLTFDLLLKKLNLGHNFWTKTDRALILHVCITRGKTFR